MLQKIIRNLIWHIDRVRLKNKDFSLITNTCLGGIISHNLGLQFQSPTVNLGIRDFDEFFLFCTHLSYYLSLPVEQVQSDFRYPVGVLKGKYGDVKLFFSHYGTFEEAVEKWEDRKKRVNYDNVIVIMDGDTCPDEVLNRFDSLPIQRKMVYTLGEKPNVKSSFPMISKKYKTAQLLVHSFLFESARWFEVFDYVSFLNKGVIKPRYVYKIFPKSSSKTE